MKGFWRSGLVVALVGMGPVAHAEGFGQKRFESGSDFLSLDLDAVYSIRMPPKQPINIVLTESPQNVLHIDPKFAKAIQDALEPIWVVLPGGPQNAVPALINPNEVRAALCIGPFPTKAGATVAIFSSKGVAIGQATAASAEKVCPRDEQPSGR